MVKGGIRRAPCFSFLYTFIIDFCLRKPGMRCIHIWYRASPTPTLKAVNDLLKTSNICVWSVCFQSYKGIPRNCIWIYPHKLEAINKHVSSFLFIHPPLHMIRYAWPPRLSGHEDFCWTRDPGKRGYVYRCLSWVHSFDTETCFGSWIWSWRCQDMPTTISRHFQNMNCTVLSLASIIRFKYQFCTDLKSILSELSNWRVNISSISMLPSPESVRNMTHVGCTMIAGGAS